MSDSQEQVDITAEMADLSFPDKAPARGFYEYEPLPPPPNRHIRLLQLLPRPEVDFPSPFWLEKETIHRSIKTRRLDEKPEFDALSYTHCSRDISRFVWKPSSVVQ
jgi:hypothetical protein